MTATQLRHEQIRPVPYENVKPAENKFLRFCVVSGVTMVLVPALMWFDIPSHGFWSNNRWWTFGSILVCISVLHTRYFDIKRNCAPNHERFDATMLWPISRRLERITPHLWVLGFALLAYSRFFEK